MVSENIGNTRPHGAETPGRCGARGKLVGVVGKGKQEATRQRMATPRGRAPNPASIRLVIESVATSITDISPMPGSVT